VLLAGRTVYDGRRDDSSRQSFFWTAENGEDGLGQSLGPEVGQTSGGIWRRMMSAASDVRAVS
jgi:hypothetical protein